MFVPRNSTLLLQYSYLSGMKGERNVVSRSGAKAVGGREKGRSRGIPAASKRGGKDDGFHHPCENIREDMSVGEQYTPMLPGRPLVSGCRGRMEHR